MKNNVGARWVKAVWRSKMLKFLLLAAFLFLWGTVPVRADIGEDGDFTVTAANTVLNRYAEVTAIAGNVITVADINTLADGGAGHYVNNALTAGSLILIYQAQGAAFTDSGDTATYGAFSYGNAGHYEFAVVASVVGNDITVDSSNNSPYACSGLSNTYDVPGNVQVVRVPQYTNLTINNGASVIGTDWNGTVGGVVAAHVRFTLTNNGTVNVTGQGFRGGVVDNATANNIVIYRSASNTNGAEKGEGILGFQAVYDANNGRYGRGAPANGGGGGNGHNAGGGGGANGNNGGVWNGSGFVSATDPSAVAWALDDGVAGGGVPAYFQGGAGGGRAGYTFSSNNQDALTVAPGNIAWGGDSRRQVGGLGGRPLINDPSSQIFFGGGGGAGDANNGAAQNGADGGGLVILVAETVGGTGQVLANGNAAGNTISGHNDAPGGGGGGGTIVIRSVVLTDALTLSANGGNGGNQLIVNNEAEGPGGGGGGGFVSVASDSGSLTATVNGGTGGTTTSLALTEFVRNGATDGYAGATSLTFNDSTAVTFPGCQTPTAIKLTAAQATADQGLPYGVIALFGLIIVTFLTLGRKYKVKEA